MYGTFDPDPNEMNFIAKDDLTINKYGKACFIIRLKNCTGNIIDLNNIDYHPTDRELLKTKIVRSVDYWFKN